METNSMNSDSSPSEDTRPGVSSLNKRKMCASSSPSRKRLKAPVNQKYSLTVDFSKVTDFLLASMFGNYEQEGIPVKEHIGEEIDAETWDEALEELVSDLNIKGADLSISSSQDLLEKCPPVLYSSSPEHRMRKDFSELIGVLEQVGDCNFDCNTADGTKEVFGKLASSLAKRTGSTEESAFPIERLLSDLMQFVDEFLYAHQNNVEITSTRRIRIHDLLTQFISQLIIVATLPNTYLEGIKTCMNGSGVPMSFKMFKEGLHTDVDDDDDVMQIEKVTFCGKPDILCSRPIRNVGKTNLAPLVIEVKTTTAADPSPSSSAPGSSSAGSKHLSSDQERYSMRRRSDPITSKINSRLEDLPHQHFVELIATLKTFNNMFKVFGMYVVMNRVYFTCLVVIDEEGNVPEDEDLIRKFTQINEVEQLSKSVECGMNNHSENLHYKLICSKWLNFLNPTHMMAILSFIRFVMLYEYKYMAIVSRIVADSG